MAPLSGGLLRSEGRAPPSLEGARPQLTNPNHSDVCRALVDVSPQAVQTGGMNALIGLELTRRSADHLAG